MVEDALREQDGLVWIYMPTDPASEPDSEPPRFENMVPS